MNNVLGIAPAAGKAFTTNYTLEQLAAHYDYLCVQFNEYGWVNYIYVVEEQWHLAHAHWRSLCERRRDGDQHRFDRMHLWLGDHRSRC